MPYITIIMREWRVERKIKKIFVASEKNVRVRISD